MFRSGSPFSARVPENAYGKQSDASRKKETFAPWCSYPAAPRALPNRGAPVMTSYPETRVLAPPAPETEAQSVIEDSESRA
jgi:hypothetical protein